MADEIGAEYLELANTQYYSWAFLNREHLLPTQEQLRQAEAVTDAWRVALAGACASSSSPRLPRRQAASAASTAGEHAADVAPDGVALPCHTARMLPGLRFPNVREHSVRDDLVRIGRLPTLPRHRLDEGALRSCEFREQDLGGCRCQAFLLAGDAAAADPVCPKSPEHGRVQEALQRAERGEPPERPLVFRDRRSRVTT
jgi:pyrroloquinoline quinone biosynthesis protein E